MKTNVLRFCNPLFHSHTAERGVSDNIYRGDHLSVTLRTFCDIFNVRNVVLEGNVFSRVCLSVQGGDPTHRFVYLGPLDPVPLNPFKPVHSGTFPPDLFKIVHYVAHNLSASRQLAFDWKSFLFYRRTPRLWPSSKLQKVANFWEGWEHPNCLQINCPWDPHLDIYENSHSNDDQSYFFS